MASTHKLAIMVVFRVGKSKYAKDLSGKGASLNGGRWNHALTPCIYAAETRALAVLEYSVNWELDDIPRALSISEIQIPDEDIIQFDEKSLPGDWRSLEVPSSTKDFLKGHLRENGAAVIKVPSVIIAQEFNYILNPRHSRFVKCSVTRITDFAFDVRIKRNQ